MTLLCFGVPLMIVLFVSCVQLCDEMLFNFDPPMCLNCEVYSLVLAIPSAKRKMFTFSLGFPLWVICTLGTHVCTSAFSFHARDEWAKHHQFLHCFIWNYIEVDSTFLDFLIPLLEIRIYIILHNLFTSHLLCFCYFVHVFYFFYGHCFNSCIL